MDTQTRPELITGEDPALARMRALLHHAPLAMAFTRGQQFELVSEHMNHLFGHGEGTELAGLNYRLWMSHGRTDVGVGFGPLAHVEPTMHGPTRLSGSVPSVTLGLRFRVSDEHLLFADASRARLGPDPDATYVTAKLGYEWKPAKSALGFEHGALGVQLDSGYRLSLKVRHGKPALYLRAQF